MSSIFAQVLQHLEAAAAKVSWLALAWGSVYLVLFFIYRHESDRERRDWRVGPTLRRDYLTALAPLYYLPAYLAHTLVATLLAVQMVRVRLVSWGEQEGYSTNLEAHLCLEPASALPLALIAVAPILLNFPAAVLLFEHPAFVPNEVARGVLGAALVASPLATWKQSWTWMRATARPLFLFVVGGGFCCAAVYVFRLAQKL